MTSPKHALEPQSFDLATRVYAAAHNCLPEHVEPGDCGLAEVAQLLSEHSAKENAVQAQLIQAQHRELMRLKGRAAEEAE